MEYAYSDNEELFHGKCPTLEHALAEALDSYPHAESFWVGTATQRTIGGYFSGLDVERMLESIAEQAHDECGEVSEDWLVMPTASKIEGEKWGERHKRTRRLVAEHIGMLTEEIRAALERWATERDEQPNFYHVGDAKCYTREEAESILAEPHH